MPQDFEGTSIPPVSAPPGVPTDLDDPYPSDEGGGSRPYNLSPKEARKLKGRLQISKRYYETHFADNYQKCLDLWRGEHWVEHAEDVEEHKVVVNMIRHIILTLHASATFKHAEIILKPTSPRGILHEETARRATHYEYRKAKAHREASRAWLDKWLFGVGIIQTGWRFETTDGDLYMTEGRLPVEGEAPGPEAVEAYLETGATEPDTMPIPRDKVRRDEAYVKRLDPRMFLVDPGASWVSDDWEYCGYRELRSLEEVKRDRRYRNTRDLKGSTKSLEDLLDDTTKRLPDEKRPSDLKRVELWHYYERRRRLHVCFTTEHDKPLLAETWAWDEDRYPFRCVFAPRTNDEFYPDPPPVLEWWPMQHEINETRSALHTHRRRFKRKYVTTADALTEKAKKQLRSGVDGTVIVTRAQNPATAFHPLQDAPLSADVYNTDKIATQDLWTLSTVGQYELGSAPTKRLTQDEVQAIQQQGGPRKARDVQEFEELCAGIAEDVLDWLQQYAVVARSLPIYDEQGNVQDWQQFTREDIQGDFDFEVYVGSTTVTNSEGQVQQIGFLLQSLQPFFQAGVLNPAPLLEQLLKQIPAVRDVKSVIATPSLLPAPGAPPSAPAAGPPEDPLQALALQAAANGAGPPIDPALLAQLGGA